jgi:MFS family permease
MLLAKWLNSVEFFLIGHFLAGVLCTLRVALFVYLAECAPDNSRGWSATALGSGANLVLLAISPLCLPGIFGNDLHWWLLPAICLLLAMIHLFVSAYFPESPKHLFIGMGQKELAKESVKFYHGSSVNIGKINVPN